MNRIIYLISTFILYCGMTSAQSSKIYVDALRGNNVNNGTLAYPVKSLSQVQKLIQGNSQKKKRITVFLRSGKYEVDQPLSFNRVNDVSHITYCAYKDEKPVISGGIEIGGWRVFDKAKNIYAAVLPKPYDSRQLFVNGVRCVRAHESDTPHRWIKYDKEGHLTSDLSVLTWRNPQDIECVYREIWTSPRCGIASFKQVGDTLVRIQMKQPGWMNCQNKGITSTHNPWYFENAYEFLDDPGEWYLDKTGAINGTANTLYYIPRTWENMHTAEVIMPVAECLVNIEGTAACNMTDITFRGIEFAYTTWLRPSGNRGNPDAQNNVLRQNRTKEGESAPEAAAINIKYANHITIEDCSLMHLGGIGVSMFAGCSDNTVKNSLLYDISGTGIQMGDYKQWEKRDSEDSFDPADKRCILSKNIITGNHVEACGVEYRSSTGIAAVFPQSCVFANNTVKNMPYSGFHIGWGWTTITHSINGNNIFKRNRVENVMVVLADGGSFYTLGPNDSIRPNLVTENYFTRTMWGQGAYLDNGSSYYHFTDNVYDKMGDFNVKINSGSHDNIATGIYSNKIKNLLAKNCDRDRIDTTYIYSESTKKHVDEIRQHAGARFTYKTAWETIPDCHIYECENADVSGNAYATSGIGTKVYDYSGMGFISGFEHGGKGSVDSKILISDAGSYTVKLRYSADQGWKDNVSLKVNGKIFPLSLSYTKRGEWKNIAISAELIKGINEISIFNTGECKGFLFLDVMNLYKNNDIHE